METVEQGSSEVVESSGTENLEETGQQGTENGTVSEGGEGTEGQTNEGESEVVENKEEELFVEKDGKQFIPKERFDQINERMKKGEEAANFLEAIKTDPVARQEFVKALGLDADNPRDSKAEEPALDAPFQDFLKSSVDPQYHGHYSAMANAIEAVLDKKFSKMLEAKYNPVMTALGGMKLEAVRKTIPDFARYEVKAAEFMRQFPGMAPEQAYILASHNDTFKKGVVKGAATNTSQQQKRNQAPITKGSQGAGSQGAKAPAKTFREAFDRAFTQRQG